MSAFSSVHALINYMNALVYCFLPFNSTFFSKSMPLILFASCRRRTMTTTMLTTLLIQVSTVRVTMLFIPRSVSFFI